MQVLMHGAIQLAIRSEKFHLNPGKQQGYLIDFWYAAELGGDARTLSDVVERSCGKSFRNFAFRRSLLRALCFYYFSRRFKLAIPEWNLYGRTACILNVFLMGKSNLVLLECIDYSDLHLKNWRAFVLRALSKYLFGPAINRSIRSMQAMTEWEKDRFSELQRIDASKIRCIQWPLNFESSAPRARNYTKAGAYVFSSGRSSCDWRTLLSAASITSWPLLIVCSSRDEAEVVELSGHVRRATILTDISEEEHNYHLARAAVNVISLKERETSAGQIRLGASIHLETPVVATAVHGLEGYLIDGTTGIAVPPGDAKAMATAIDKLFYDEIEQKQLAKRALAFASELTRQKYFENILELIEKAENSDGSNRNI